MEYIEYISTSTSTSISTSTSTSSTSTSTSICTSTSTAAWGRTLCRNGAVSDLAKKQRFFKENYAFYSFFSMHKYTQTICNSKCQHRFLPKSSPMHTNTSYVSNPSILPYHANNRVSPRSTFKGLSATLCTLRNDTHIVHIQHTWRMLWEPGKRHEADTIYL